MSRSAFISLALHLAILLWAIVVLPSGKALDAPAIQEMPIDVLTPSEFTKIKAGMQEEKDDAPLASKPDLTKPSPSTEKQPKKPPIQQAALPPSAAEEQTDDTPPPPKPDKAEEEKTPDPTPDKPADKKADVKPPEKSPDAEAAPKPEKDKPKQAEAKKDPQPKKVEEKPKPKPKLVKEEKPKKPKPQHTENKHDFNTDRIAALLNKVPDAASDPHAENAPQNAPKRVHGQSNGTQLTMSANEIDALRAKIAQCWSPPPGGLGADALIVKIHMQLNQDGTLVGYPTVENSDGSPFFQAAADAATRAVYQCQPYSLPADKYSVWNDIILTFDPRQMYSPG